MTTLPPVPDGFSWKPVTSIEGGKFQLNTDGPRKYDVWHVNFQNEKITVSYYGDKTKICGSVEEAFQIFDDFVVEFSREKELKSKIECFGKGLIEITKPENTDVWKALAALQEELQELKWKVERLEERD